MYLGLDIGTSSVKAVLIDDRQRIVASETADSRGFATAFRLVGAGPGQLVDGLRGGARQACRVAQGGARRRSAASASPATCTARRCSTPPTSRCVPASCGTTGARPRKPRNSMRTPSFRAITGNIVMPGFTAPKLVWVARHEPEIFAKVAEGAAAQGLCPAEADRRQRLRHVGLGRHARGSTSPSATGATSCWPRPGCRAPRCRSSIEGSAATGTLRPELAQALGHGRRPVVVAGGGGDNAASACGVGVVKPGTAFVSLGTSGVLFVSNARFSPDPATAVHAFCHAVPDTWHQMGVILSAAGALEWLADVFSTSAAALTRPLEDDASGPGDVDLPALSRRRAHAAQRRGHPRRLRRPRATPPTRRRSPAPCWRASPSPSPTACGALTEAGASVERALAVGGGSRSKKWLRIIANALDIVVDVPEEGDFGAGLGAARLGLIAAENADPFAVCAQPAIRETIEPDPELVPGLRRRLRDLPEALPRYQGGHAPMSARFFNQEKPIKFAGGKAGDGLAYPLVRPQQEGSRQAHGGSSPLCRLPTGTPSPGTAATCSAARPSCVRGCTWTTRWRRRS